MISATLAFVVSLIEIVYIGDIGVLFDLVVLVVVGIVVLSVGIALPKGRQRIILVSCVSAFLLVATAITFSQWRIRPRLLWALRSSHYEADVLATSSAGTGEFRHSEWDGDGWGSGATGDWMGYIVFDPTDSLSSEIKHNSIREYKGIPCDVILVRRLEKQWYSVVLGMNQFWDEKHPNCGR